MPQDYKDATYSANTGLNGQVAPTLYLSPGENGVFATKAVSAMVTGTGVPGFNSIIAAEQVLAVAAAQSHPGSRLAV
jgi:hypothetical protein